MKLLAWNIQSGGAKRAKLIVDEVQTLDPDVAVLTEVRATSAPLLQALAQVGWDQQVVGTGAPGCGGVAVISRLPLTRRSAAPTDDAFPGRWVEVEIEGASLSIVGLYGPLQKEDFDGYWRTVIGELDRRRGEPIVVAGDLNTGESEVDAPSKNFFCSSHFGALKAMGYVDGWRRVHQDRRDYTWYSRKKGGGLLNGFRLDHALLSPALENRLVDARYEHGPRERRVSDHSPLVVELRSNSEAVALA